MSIVSSLRGTVTRPLLGERLSSALKVSVRQECASIVSKFRAVLDCRREVYQNMTLRRPAAIDACRCYPPCSDITYDSTYSLSTLPPITREHATFYTPLDLFLQDTISPDKRRLLGVNVNDKNAVPVRLRPVTYGTAHCFSPRYTAKS